MRFPRPRVLPVLLTLAIFGLAGFASLDATAAPAGTKQAGTKEEASATLTVGALARMMVKEAALDPPVRGYDQFVSLRVLNSYGYRTPEDPDRQATVGDLGEMLDGFGIANTTSSPLLPLTLAHAQRVIQKARPGIPRFRVPEGSTKTESREDREESQDQCNIDFQQCRRDCNVQSPSGRSRNEIGTCMRTCAAVRKSCRAAQVLNLTP